MFGLIKSHSCSQTQEQKQQWRLCYCGTCKTLGALYGNRSRFLLNTDAVFLGEILLAFKMGLEFQNEWPDSFASYNCLSLAGRRDEPPIELQYAATATATLAGFKIADHISDTGGIRWRIANRLLDSSFDRAFKKLEEWDFPLDSLRGCQTDQLHREDELTSGQQVGSAEDILDYLSEPTARATSLFFRHSCNLIRRPASQECMGRLGRNLGRLAYIIDALEDYEKDARRGEFNAIRIAYSLKEPALPEMHRNHIVDNLLHIGNEVENDIRQLCITPEAADNFTLRVRSSLNSRLGLKNQARVHRCETRKKSRLTLNDRWHTAVSVARKHSLTHLQSGSSILKQTSMPFAFGAVFMVALAFPHEAESSASSRECIGLGFNLMLLGSLVTSITTAFRSRLKYFGMEAPAPGRPHPKRGQKDESRCSFCCCPFDCCDEDCCDGCDCCSDCDCGGCDC